MKSCFITLMYRFLLAFFFVTAMLVSSTAQELTEKQKAEILSQIEEIEEKDQRYRTPLAIGTLNDSILAVVEAKSKTMEIMEYYTFKQSLNLNLPKDVQDSLWHLQRQLDAENLAHLKTLVQTYGYPSKERLGTTEDNLFVVLLHPPYALAEIPTFMEEMSALLLPEVKAGRMPPKFFALFYDNMLGKILRKPQLYGTNQQFDTKTRTVLPPGIVDLKKTNEARLQIGLPILKEGEYRIIKAEK